MYTCTSLHAHSFDACSGGCVKSMHSGADWHCYHWDLLAASCTFFFHFQHSFHFLILSWSSPFQLLSLQPNTHLSNCISHLALFGCWRHTGEDLWPRPSQFSLLPLFPFCLFHLSLSAAKLNLALRVLPRLSWALPKQHSGRLFLCFPLAHVREWHSGPGPELWIYVMSVV